MIKLDYFTEIISFDVKNLWLLHEFVTQLVTKFVQGQHMEFSLEYYPTLIRILPKLTETHLLTKTDQNSLGMGFGSSIYKTHIIGGMRHEM